MFRSAVSPRRGLRCGVAGLVALLGAAGFHPVLAETAPEAFSVQYLSGRTLYQVFHEEDGDEDFQGPGVIRVQFFGDRTLSYTGLVGDLSTGSANWDVDSSGRLFAGEDGPGDGSLVACGSTEQYFTGHWLDDGRWDGTHLWFYNEADALAFASTMTGDPAPCPSGPGFVYPPSLSLTVDGDASDWDGVPPVLTDPAGDQNGSASKDITEIGAAMDANRFTVRLRTSGPIALPHSPQSEWSHYSISLHFGSGYGCEQDLDNLSVNNFTQWNGQNWHQGELWNSGWSFRKATYPAQSAHTGDTLEMALSTTVIPIGARSFWIGAQAMSFNPDVAGDNTWSGSDANACYQINVTDLYRAAMQRVYVAYYGRPADPAGAGWWGEQLAANNGNLDALIQQFGTSQEFDERYGSLDYGTLLDTIYQQMFGRFPDPGGKAFYLGKLQSGAMSLQSITLNVLDGSQNEDLQTVANKLEVASYITAQIANRGLDYTSDDIATAWGILSAVNSNLQSADTAIGIADGWLDAKTPL